jgi:septal ring factor EnvC (AmiA/AmiB activator)
MIMFIMLVALGFLAATLLALLLAPLFWRRAERLTTRRIEQSMPMSIAETEADRDQLRASYAIIIRRLEAALSQEKMRSASQLVKISRLEMEIANLNDRTAQLRGQLEAENNAASVLRRTIATRVPELNRVAQDANQLVHIRDREINSIVNRLRHREEALTIAQRTTEMQQAEISRLRQAMEMSGSQNAGRFKKRPTQWSIHDYRAEYDRLNVELSKLRERLSVAYDREANEVTQLRTELQQLADQIVTTASAMPEEREHAAIAQEKSDHEPQRRLGRPDAKSDAPRYDRAMRSIDGIIADETTVQRSRMPARTTNEAVTHTQTGRARGLARAALAPTRLARGAMAKVATLAGSVRNTDNQGTAGTRQTGGEETSTPVTGRLSAAKLLGGGAVDAGAPVGNPTPGAEASTPTSTPPLSDEEVDKMLAQDNASAEETAKPGTTAGDDRLGPRGTADQPPKTRDSADDTPVSGAAQQDAGTEDVSTDDDSLYDRLRAAKPASGSLMSAKSAPDAPNADKADENDNNEPSAASQDDPFASPDQPDGDGTAAPEAGDTPTNSSSGADDEADSDADTANSAASLLDRLKQVPENQTR